MTPSLRHIAVALLAGSSAVLLVLSARAEPLDKAACAELQAERSKLLTREMAAALERGPDWVKDHLNDEDLSRVRQFLGVEEQIEFRCRGGGVDKPKPDLVPLPDRKPTLPQTETATTTPSDATSEPTATTEVNATTESPTTGQTSTPSLLPERKPISEAAATAASPNAGSGQNASEHAKDTEAGPSQTVADSDKTVTTKTKATR
jgi:hypothetical protein